MSRIIAAFAYRYEPDWLIDDLRENLSWVDGFAELNDRDRSDLWGVRGDRTHRLMRIAMAMEPDWIFYTAPDERLEDRAATVLRRLAERGRHDRYSVRLREMWTPDRYRVDGVWGGKRRGRLCWPAALGLLATQDRGRRLRGSSRHHPRVLQRGRCWRRRGRRRRGDARRSGR